jgi:hypothetical protein
MERAVGWRPAKARPRGQGRVVLHLRGVGQLVQHAGQFADGRGVRPLTDKNLSSE